MINWRVAASGAHVFHTYSVGPRFLVTMVFSVHTEMKTTIFSKIFTLELKVCGFRRSGPYSCDNERHNNETPPAFLFFIANFTHTRISAWCWNILSSALSKCASLGLLEWWSGDENTERLIMKLKLSRVPKSWASMLQGQCVVDHSVNTR